MSVHVNGIEIMEFFPMCLRGFSLCSALAHADKSILMKYKYQGLFKHQRRDESST